MSARGTAAWVLLGVGVLAVAGMGFVLMRSAWQSEPPLPAGGRGASGTMRMIVNRRVSTKDLMERAQRDQVDRFVSEQVLRTALEYPDVRDCRWARLRRGAGEDLLKTLQDRLRATPIKDSGLVEVRLYDAEEAGAA